MKLFITIFLVCLGPSVFAATERYTVATTARQGSKIDWVVNLDQESGHFESCVLNICTDLSYGRNLKAEDLPAVMLKLQENMQTLASANFFKSQAVSGIRTDFFFAKAGVYFGTLFLAPIALFEYVTKRSPETMATAGLVFGVLWGTLYLVYRIEKSTAPTLESLAQQMKPLLIDPAHAKPLVLTHWQFENFSEALGAASLQVILERKPLNIIQ